LEKCISLVDLMTSISGGCGRI